MDGGGGGRYWATSADTDREFTRALQIALSQRSSSTFPSTPPAPPTTFTTVPTFPKPVPVAGVKGRKTFKRKPKRPSALLSSTRYIDTDICNFKEMVHKFTGVEGEGRMDFVKRENPVKFVRKPESCIPMLDTSANLFNYGTKELKSTFPPPETIPEFLTSESWGWEDLLRTGISDSLPSIFLPSPTCGGAGSSEFMVTPPALETGINSIVPVPDVG